MLNTVEEGLEDIRQGKVLIVVDDEDRENEGDFIVSGEKITPEIVNFMITHGRGLLCAPLPRSRCEELGLAPMAEENTSLLGTPFTTHRRDCRPYRPHQGACGCHDRGAVRQQ